MFRKLFKIIGFFFLNAVFYIGYYGYIDTLCEYPRWQ